MYVIVTIAVGQLVNCYLAFATPLHLSPPTALFSKEKVEENFPQEFFRVHREVRILGWDFVFCSWWCRY